MKESQFIEENKKDWKSLELLLVQKHPDPEQFRRLFEKVSCDLSYARTYYPNRRVRQYLNDLINAVFDNMRVKKSTNLLKTISHFYTDTLPTKIIQNKEAFFLSTGIFLIAVLIGIFSTYTDHEFLRLVLGDSYVEFTLDNINNGDPMAVYKFDNSTIGFLKITINNIKVAFLAFSLGIFLGLGTFFVLLKNGIMLGAFQSFFAINGLFLTSFLTIWIHGTIEISSIIVAGAAGIILGNGLLFPKTFSRLNSLRLAAVNAITIMLSTVPLFVIAGFLEGFVTRQTEIPDAFKVVIIGLSLLFILSIYLIYPIVYYKKGKYRPGALVGESYQIHSWDNKNTNNRSNQVSLIQYCSQKYVVNLASLLKKFIIPASLIFGILLYAIFYFKDRQNYGTTWNSDTFGEIISGPLGIFISTLFLTWMVVQTSGIFNQKTLTLKDFTQISIKQIIPLLAIIVIFISFFAINSNAISLLTIAILPTAGFFLSIDVAVQEKNTESMIFLKIFNRSKNLFFSVVWVKLIGTILAFYLFFLLGQGLETALFEMVNWHQFFDHGILQKLFITLFFKALLFFAFFPYLFLLFTKALKQALSLEESTDLKIRLRNFGTKTEVK